MKWLNFLRLKKLILSINRDNQVLKDFQEYIQLKEQVNCTSVGKNSLTNILATYEIRFQRYQEEDTGVFHYGFEETMNHLRKYNKKFVKIHSFDNEKISYTVFTDISFKELIGIIQHVPK